jgi:hypothetical protein
MTPDPLDSPLRPRFPRELVGFHARGKPQPPVESPKPPRETVELSTLAFGATDLVSLESVAEAVCGDVLCVEVR